MAKFEAGASSAAGSRFTRRELLRRSATVAAANGACGERRRPLCSTSPPIPQMFAQVAQRKLSAADAARAAGRDLKDIFGKWRRLGKI
jgi:hypothetical protein